VLKKEKSSRRREGRRKGVSPFYMLREEDLVATQREKEALPPAERVVRWPWASNTRLWEGSGGVGEILLNEEFSINRRLKRGKSFEGESQFDRRGNGRLHSAGNLGKRRRTRSEEGSRYSRNTHEFFRRNG